MIIINIVDGQPERDPFGVKDAILFEATTTEIKVYQAGDELPKPSADELLKAKIAQIATEMRQNVQNRLDAFARACGYDDIFTAVGYITDPVFGPEAQIAVNARSATWVAANAIEEQLMADLTAAVQAGAVDSFSWPSWEDIEAELPVLVWPEGTRGYNG